VQSADLQSAAAQPSSLKSDLAESDSAALANGKVEKAQELTPFMRQWTSAKRENPDALLFFRMGDFYELFYDDAVTASRELQLTLTARDRERLVPMCGVPYHSVETYLTRLLRRGFRIAICEQMEDPKLTKKIVKREVIRVLSPGTAMDSALGQERNNFLAAYFESGPEKQAICAVALLDVSTGEFSTAEFQGTKARQQALDALLLAGPSEVLLAASAEMPGTLEKIGFSRATLLFLLLSGSCRCGHLKGMD
jgi:DNA mismatch repair protein MutS